jgi:hypothetical protein
MAAHPNLKTLSQAFNTHFLIRHFLLEVGRSKFKAATIDEPSLWAPEDPSPNTQLPTVPGYIHEVYLYRLRK